MNEWHFTCTWPLPELSIKTYQPLDKKYIGTVHWKKAIKIHLYSDGGIINKRKWQYSLGYYALLKSNLQKQVRRGKISAIATAQKMLELNPFELLRRLIIISAEDVQLSEQTAVLTWLMMAVSKGFVLELIHIKWILGYINTLLKTPYKNCLNSDNANKDIFNCEHPQKEYLLAIFLRTGYGGLACDPPLISSSVNYYIQNNEPLLQLNIVEYTEPLKLVINPAAIDFHIYPAILKKLKEKYPQWEELYLRKVIWVCSSNINYRKMVNSHNLISCWKTIKGDFHQLGLDYVKKYYLNNIS